MRRCSHTKKMRTLWCTDRLCGARQRLFPVLCLHTSTDTNADNGFSPSCGSNKCSSSHELRYSRLWYQLRNQRLTQPNNEQRCSQNYTSINHEITYIYSWEMQHQTYNTPLNLWISNHQYTKLKQALNFLQQILLILTLFKNFIDVWVIYLVC